MPLPPEAIKIDNLNWVCQQYAVKEFAENLVLLDTGFVKLMVSSYPG